MAGNLVQGALFTVMVIRAGLLSDPAFEAELTEQVRRSPRFFRDAPVVLDLKSADGFAASAEFAEARRLLRGHTLSLVGIQNALPAQREAAAAAGLASFAPNAREPSRRVRPEPEREPEPEPQPEPQPPPSQASASPPPPLSPAERTRLVTEPVRSGTQIYARGGDLIIVAPVSPGAELVADGNIHVYGTLRGRALAGASGDVGARIFCSRLEAELVSIAGHYLVSEQLPADQLHLAVQIALVDERLTVMPN